MVCDCKTKKCCLDEFMTEFCIECGRIWVNDLVGTSYPTQRFNTSVRQQQFGIWVGHMFVKGARLGDLGK
jgi:hypothetical protein